MTDTPKNDYDPYDEIAGMFMSPQPNATSSGPRKRWPRSIAKSGIEDRPI